MSETAHEIPTPPGPLAGVRVLDLTSVVLGPLATQILGDYGADIIKVESLTGDTNRTSGVARNPFMGSIFLSINRNKRSLAVDLKSDDGRQIIERLLPTIDVVVHNMRPAAMKRLKLDYDAVRRIKSDIVYCVATGYGAAGPDGGRPVFDDIVQAGCGLVDTIHRQNGVAEYVPTLIADKAAGLATVNAILAALFHRERTGQGQHVEVPMFETMVAFTLVEHQGGHAFCPPSGEIGYARLMNGGRRPCKTLDGYVAVLPYSPRHWKELFKAVGRPELVDSYSLDDAANINAQIQHLYAELQSVISSITTEECLGLFDRLDIPSTPIVTLTDLPNHPHLQAVELFKTFNHPSEGPILQVRPTTIFERTPATIRREAPRIGQHTLEILGEAGFSNEEIELLLTQKVIVSSQFEDIN